MARYKDYNQNQSKLIPIVFSEQIVPGSFEHTINFLVDEYIDMSVFDARYKNDEAGRPAIDPAILLKVILSAYSRGLSSSSQIERLCRENNDRGLIGGEMFAIDGCKLPSNASKEHSGTHAEMTKKQKKINRAVRRMLAKHREEDQSGHENDHTRRAAEEKNIEELRKASRKIKKFLGSAEDRLGLNGKVVKSNITDNESAKMLTSHGVLQGYNGVAAVDDKHQIIVGGEAFGQGPENNLLKPMIEAVSDNLGNDYIKKAKITADSGFHSKVAVEECFESGLDVYLADGNFRKRDPRFINRDRYQPNSRKNKWFKSEDFNYDRESGQCCCPAGKEMWSGGTRKINDVEYIAFSGYLNDCRECPLQKQCMRNPPTKQGRQVSIKLTSSSGKGLSAIQKMKERIDSDEGRHIYSKRLGAVEPVFGNINTTKRLNRFTLRGKTKVNAQWLMFCMVHNVEKVQRYGLTG